jgi:putative spermidine/putrescine transport system substrate-binding protein
MRQLASLALAVATLLAAVSPAQAAKEFDGVTLNVNGYGGGFDEVLKQTVARPLKDKYGIDVVYQPGTALQAISKIMASKDNPPLDILMMDSPNFPSVMEAGIIDQVTDAEVPAIRNLHKGVREFGNYGVPFIYAYMVLSYNKEKIKNPPASYLDLARPEYKGRLAMFNLENNGGVLTLLALAEASGGGVNNIAPGFAKLRELKASLVSTPSANPALVQLFQQGEAWVAPNWSGRVLTLQSEAFPVEMVVPKEGLYSVLSYVNLVKGTKQRAAALKYIEQAISPEAGLGMAQKFSYPPTNATTKLPDDLGKKLILYGDGVNKARMADWAAIARNRGAWIEQWNKEMTK